MQSTDNMANRLGDAKTIMPAGKNW